MIGPQCFIADAIHQTDGSGEIKDQPTTHRSIVIEDGVWIGAGSIVLAGVRLGAGCIIGAGSVVTQDVPERTIVASIGTRVIKKR